MNEELNFLKHSKLWKKRNVYSRIPNLRNLLRKKVRK
jgi:hypothetical protein